MLQFWTVVPCWLEYIPVPLPLLPLLMLWLRQSNVMFDAPMVIALAPLADALSLRQYTLLGLERVAGMSACPM